MTAPCAPERALSVTALPSTRPGRVVVRVVGEVDTSTAPLLDACLRSHATRSATRDLVIDVRRGAFLDEAGAHAVGRAELLCRRRGARLRLRGSAAVSERTTG